MSEYSITDFRINGERYYLVEKENKVSFYTTNIAAARYWIRSEMNDPTLIRPFHAVTPVDQGEMQKIEQDLQSTDAETKIETSADTLDESKPQESVEQDPDVPKKPVRIS
jgi:hypothetical protein